MSEIVNLIGAFVKLLSSIPSILGVLGALVCYRYVSNDWWWVVMTYLVILANGKISVILWRNYWQWHRHRQHVRYINNESKKQENRNKQNKLHDVKVFFLTLSEQNLKELVSVYNTNDDSTGYCNERIVTTDDLVVYLNAQHILDLEFGKLYNEARYICSKNNQYDSSPIHIWFHPYLNVLLKNYVENGVKDYPNDFKA